jgi:mRNA interferase RelE/StbE
VTDESPGSYEVRVTPAARRQIKRLSKQNQARVVDELRALAADPRHHGYGPVVNHPGLFKVRIGDYRIVYTIDDDVLVVLVVKVGHRSEVYKRLGDLVRSR